MRCAIKGMNALGKIHEVGEFLSVSSTQGTIDLMPVISRINPDDILRGRICCHNLDGSKRPNLRTLRFND